MHDGKRFKDYATPVKNSSSRSTIDTTPLKNQASFADFSDSEERELRQELKPRSKAFQQQPGRGKQRTIALAKKKTAKPAASANAASLLSPRPKESPRVLGGPSPAVQAAFASPQQQLTPSKLAKSGSLNAVILSISTPNRMNNPTMSIAERNRIFEECLRAATDNKINSKNTWSAPLIDYFAQLAFLDDSTSQSSSNKKAPEESVNFQRASCTLDGCVKIYSSRVDSVAEATAKLLSGLGTSAPTTAGTPHFES